MAVLGQKAKYSLRAEVFRFAPESGLNSEEVHIAGGRFVPILLQKPKIDQPQKSRER
jgi:hypothetical protein